MIQIAELACDSSVVLPLGVLSRRPGGAVTLSGNSFTTSIVDEELQDADVLVVAASAHGLAALGEASHCLIGWDASHRVLGRTAEVPRLDLTGYDPGGLQRVLIRRCGESQLLLETEVSVSLLDRWFRVIWSRVHGDLTARVTHATDGSVRVESDRTADYFSLADGSDVRSEALRR